jgi:hypothetical protein
VDAVLVLFGGLAGDVLQVLADQWFSLGHKVSLLMVAEAYQPLAPASIRFSGSPGASVEGGERRQAELAGALPAPVVSGRAERPGEGGVMRPARGLVADTARS